MRRLNSLLTASKPSPIAISGIMKVSAAMNEIGACCGDTVKMRRNRYWSDCVTSRSVCRVKPTGSAPNTITNRVSTSMRVLLR